MSCAEYISSGDFEQEKSSPEKKAQKPTVCESSTLKPNLTELGMGDLGCVKRLCTQTLVRVVNGVKSKDFLQTGLFSPFLFLPAKHMPDITIFLIKRYLRQERFF